MNDDDPAIGAYEALANREYLERTSTLLKASPLFSSFSRRLLFDLVERSGVHVLRHGVPDDFVDEGPTNPAIPKPGPFLAIVVLQGTVLASSKQLVGGAPPAPPNPAAGVVLYPRVYLRTDEGVRGITTGELRLTAASRCATFVAISPWALDDSPTAAWSLDLRAFRVPDLVPALARARRTELIWMSTSADADVPLEAAMHILGAAAAREILDAPVVLYICGAQPKCLDWDRDGHRFVLRQTAPDPHDFVDQAGRRDRIFFGHPEHPLYPPQNVDFPFDRAVHLTTQLPSVLPEEFRKILRSGLLQRGQESTFSSFIASVLIGYDPTSAPGSGLCYKGEFEALALPSGADGEPATRPYRDACALRVDGPQLQRAWKTWIEGDPEHLPPFVDVADRERAMRKETNERWARAVTNRRVGFALSGGGASAYRAGPLLSRIEAARIPIDVFAALSGGALVGAFCCGSEPGGFNLVKSLGPFFQLTLPGVLIWTWPFEAVVDALLAGTRVEDLETRFAAVAVSLPDRTVPQATVVVRGTLGEAVRVSGNLPPSFAPATKHSTRYTDGGAGSVVPAQVARDCGADIVLACNAVPGPSLGNPLSALPGAAWLLRWTPWVGRMIDSYTWNSFFFHQISRKFGEDAEVFVDFLPQAFPMFESTAFIAADWIVADAEGEGDMLDARVDDLKQKWSELRPPDPPSVPPERPVSRPASGGPRKRARHKRRK